MAARIDISAIANGINEEGSGRVAWLVYALRHDITTNTNKTTYASASFYYASSYHIFCSVYTLGYHVFRIHIGLASFCYLSRWATLLSILGLTFHAHWARSGIAADIDGASSISRNLVGSPIITIVSRYHLHSFYHMKSPRTLPRAAGTQMTTLVQ